MAFFDFFRPGQWMRSIPLVGRITSWWAPKAAPGEGLEAYLRSTEAGVAGTAAPGSYQQQILQLKYERRAIIQDIRRLLLEDPRLGQADRKTAREAVRAGIVVTVTGKDEASPHEQAQQVVDKVNKQAKINNKLVSWAQMLRSEGDLFLQIVAQEDRVVNVKRMPAISMERITDERDSFPDVGRAFCQWDIETESEVATFALWQIVHQRWNHVDGDKYGVSEYIQLRGPWRMLQLAEQSQVVRRMTRAAQRRLHKVGTKEHPARPAGPGSIEEYKKQNGFDKPQDVWDPLNQTLDFFSTGLTEIDVLESDRNIHQIDDIKHLQDVCVMGTGAPKAIIGLDAEKINRDILKDQRAEWLKDTNALSKKLSEALEQVYEIALIIGGINPDSVSISIRFSESNMETPSDRVDRVTKLRQNAIGAVPDPLISKAKAMEMLAEDMGLHSVELEMTRIQQELEANGTMDLLRKMASRGADEDNKTREKRPVQDAAPDIDMMVPNPETVSIVAVCLLDDKGRVLLIRRADVSPGGQNRPDEWECPAGHREPGESLKEAAWRELYEETGLGGEFLGDWQEFITREGLRGVTLLCRTPFAGKPRLDPREHDDGKWVPLDQVGRYQPQPPNLATHLWHLASPMLPQKDTRAAGNPTEDLISELRGVLQTTHRSSRALLHAALGQNGNGRH